MGPQEVPWSPGSAMDPIAIRRETRMAGYRLTQRHSDLVAREIKARGEICGQYHHVMRRRLDGSVTIGLPRPPVVDGSPSGSSKG